MSIHAERAHRHAMQTANDLGLSPADHGDALAEMLGHPHLAKVFAAADEGGPDETEKGDALLKLAVAAFRGAVQAGIEHCEDKGVRPSPALLCVSYHLTDMADDLEDDGFE